MAEFTFDFIKDQANILGRQSFTAICAGRVVRICSIIFRCRKSQTVLFLNRNRGECVSLASTKDPSSAFLSGSATLNDARDFIKSRVHPE